jgi:hypothetical protein
MYKRGFAEMKRMEFNRLDGEKEWENGRLDSRGRDPDVVVQCNFFLLVPSLESHPPGCGIG